MTGWALLLVQSSLIILLTTGNVMRRNMVGAVGDIHNNKNYFYITIIPCYQLTTFLKYKHLLMGKVMYMPYIKL
jgi:hypothetical protein